MGAWPVFGFFGLDVLVIYWAFRINFRRAAATEEIIGDAIGIAGAPGQPSRPCRRMGAQSALGAARPEGHAEFGIERLYLVSRGRRVSIGNFLGPDEKASFAKALMAALQTAKRGLTYNPGQLIGLSEIGWFGAAHAPYIRPHDDTSPYMTNA